MEDEISLWNPKEVTYIEPESLKKYYQSNQIIHIHMKQHQVVTKIPMQLSIYEHAIYLLPDR